MGDVCTQGNYLLFTPDPLPILIYCSYDIKRHTNAKINFRKFNILTKKLSEEY